MSQSIATRSWFPEKKRADVEFFKKLQMLRDDLHLQERENMKSAVARIESKRYGRRNPPVERDKEKLRYSNVKTKTPISVFNDRRGRAGVRMWKDSCFIEVSDVALRPWDRGDEFSSRMPYQSVGEGSRKNRLNYHIKNQSSNAKSRQSKSGISNKIYSDMTIPNSTEDTIARIAMNMSDFNGYNNLDFMRNPDHLPSIPNIGHRLPISHNNRLKAMTWESDFSEPVRTKRSEIGTKATSLASNVQREVKIVRRLSMEKRKHEGLRFDVNLNDKEVFKFLNSEVLPSTPKSQLFSRDLEEDVYPVIPLVSLHIETNSDDDEDDLDSSKSGELHCAMRKLLIAHESFMGLKEELQSITNLNDRLENCEDVETKPSESVDNIDDVETKPSESVDNFDDVETKPSESVEHFEDVEKESGEIVENFEGVEKKSSEAVENFENVEKKSSETVERFGNAEKSNETVKHFETIEHFENVGKTSSETVAYIEDVEKKSSEIVEHFEDVEKTSSEIAENFENVVKNSSETVKN